MEDEINEEVAILTVAIGILPDHVESYLRTLDPLFQLRHPCCRAFSWL